MKNVHGSPLMAGDWTLDEWRAAEGAVFENRIKYPPDSLSAIYKDIATHLQAKLNRLAAPKVVNSKEEPDYRSSDCKKCGRMRVEKNGICEKCKWDNDHDCYAIPEDDGHCPDCGSTMCPSEEHCTNCETCECIITPASKIEEQDGEQELPASPIIQTHPLSKRRYFVHVDEYAIVYIEALEAHLKAKSVDSLSPSEPTERNIHGELLPEEDDARLDAHDFYTHRSDIDLPAAEFIEADYYMAWRWYGLFMVPCTEERLGAMAWRIGRERQLLATIAERNAALKRIQELESQLKEKPVS